MEKVDLRTRLTKIRQQALEEYTATTTVIVSNVSAVILSELTFVNNSSKCRPSSTRTWNISSLAKTGMLPDRKPLSSDDLDDIAEGILKFFNMIDIQFTRSCVRGELWLTFNLSDNCLKSCCYESECCPHDQLKKIHEGFELALMKFQDEVKKKAQPKFREIEARLEAAAKDIHTKEVFFNLPSNITSDFREGLAKELIKMLKKENLEAEYYAHNDYLRITI
jgi:hypothetical protein